MLVALATVWTDAALECPAAAAPIRIDLISEARAIAPGEVFTVAIRQRMKPGYHTYWRNPGTVGLATRVEWKLPDGFKAGPIQWQAPELTVMAAYQVWGYEKEALLLVDIQAPETLTVGDEVVVAGDVTWMCCGKQCHPGFKELSLVLPIAEKPKVNRRLQGAFNRVRAEQPRTMKGWKVECSAKEDAYTLRVSPAAQINGDVRFFDYDRQVSSDKPQRLKRDGISLVLDLQQEAHSGERLGRLRGVLRLGESGNFKVVAVDAPISRE